jgi:hypothetical protein
MTPVMNSRPIQHIFLSKRMLLQKIQINSRGNMKMTKSTFAPPTIMLTMLPLNLYMLRKVPSNHQLKKLKNVTRYKLKIQIMNLHNSNNIRTLRPTRSIIINQLQMTTSAQRDMTAFNSKMLLKWSSSINQ